MAFIGNPVSDCCWATVRLLPVYNEDGSEATNIALGPNDNLNRCSKCKKPCQVIEKPKN